MKLFKYKLFSLLLAISMNSQASVIVGGTRLIYNENKREVSLNLNNPDKGAYLVQSWIENEEKHKENTPFIVTPPLFRLDPGQNNVLRIIKIGGDMKNDRESMFWMNIKSIPSINQDDSKNTLQIAIKTRIKLIYRPNNIKGSPESETDKLIWSINGSSINVKNPTPFFMNFHEVLINDIEINGANYVAPMSSADFKYQNKIKSGKIRWKVINDFGSIGGEHEKNIIISNN